MTTYVLTISSFKGRVPGAVHYHGKVQGEYPPSCHGGTVYNAPEHRGKTTCTDGHELPERAEWDVEAAWTVERYERWAAKEFEGDGPTQFMDEATLTASAVSRFLGQVPHQWFEAKLPELKPGDQLYYGFVASGPGEVDESDGYGGLLTEVPGRKPEGEADGITAV